MRNLKDFLGELILVSVVFALGFAGYYMSLNYESLQKEETKRAKIKSGLELKTGDYTTNDIPDKFYLINGEKVPYEVDGKPVFEYFKNQ